MQARMLNMSSRIARITLTILPIAALSLACSQKMPAPFEPEKHTMRDDRDAPFNPPERYPEWAFDQPEYVKPAAAPQPEPAARPTDPPHFFTNKRVVMVEQPTGYTPEETPRIAIYYTDDNGFNWHKAGYFGRQQSFFPLETEKDGDYGVRFVGPGQQLAEHTPAYPDRMYHVDTMLPEVKINIDPEKTWYDVGEDIRISWEAKDPHLEQFPVRIGMLMDFTASEGDLIELQRDLPDDGSIDYHISSETEGHEIVFRAEALDRASNLGLAYSHALQIKERADEKILTKDHHDDRIRTARRATPSTRKHATKSTLTMQRPVGNSTTAMTSTGDNATKAPKPKTRVKVVTIGHRESKGDKPNATPMTSTTPAQNKPKSDAATPMSSATMNDKDDDFTKLLNCDEKVEYEKSVSPAENDADAVAADTQQKTSPKTSPPKTMTIQEALAPLKKAIGKIADYKRSTETNATPAQPVDASDSHDNRPTAVVGDVKTTKPVDASSANPTVNVTQSRPAVSIASPTRVASPRTTSVAARPTTPNTARAISNRSRTPVDSARGNELVAPMPGTVSQTTVANDVSHPWRTLGTKSATANAGTWTLPEAKAAVSAKPTGDPQHPTKGPVLVDVREPDEIPAD